jgi:general secretion pathway protein A
MDNTFNISPDPTMLFLTPNLRAVIEKVRYVIETRQGLTFIEGEIGTGKSSVLRYLWQSYAAQENASAIFIPTPEYRSTFAFLKDICAEFDLPIRASMQKQLVEFNRFLLQEYSENRVVIIFIDEAQIIKGPQLELIRTLLNFETNTAKLVQIVIAAQLEMRRKLADESKRAIRSRIVVGSTLSALSPDETARMIQFRCDQTNIKNPFTADAVAAIYKKTNGIAREILKTCGLGLRLMQMAGLKSIEVSAIEAIHSEATIGG